MNTYEKVDDTTIKVIREIQPEEKTYDLDFLQQQLIDIQRQKDEFDAERDRELAEIQELISQSERLGIMTKANLLTKANVEN